MQNYEVDSDVITSSKIGHALSRSMTVSQGKAVDLEKISDKVEPPVSTNTQKRRGSLFPGELLSMS